MLPIAEWHRGYSWSRRAPWQKGGRGGKGTWARSKKGQEEDNAQTPVRMTMTMDEMEKTRTKHLSHCDSVNRSDDTSTNGAQCAQCCAVISSVCVMLLTQLVTLRSALLRLCMKLYTMFRSLFVS